MYIWVMPPNAVTLAFPNDHPVLVIQVNLIVGSISLGGSSQRHSSSFTRSRLPR